MTSIPAVEIQKLFARSEELYGSASEIESGTLQELRKVFSRTKELAMELMRDNEHLRVQNLLLEKQKNEADHRFDHSQLGKENEQLKAELELLGKRLSETENKSQEFRRRYEDIEQYNTALSSVNIASNRLHSTLDFSEVVSVAREILWNLVAASSFAIFLRNEKTGELLLVGGEGIEGRFQSDRLDEPTGMIADTLAEGVSLFIDGEAKGDPLACIPLKIEGRGGVGLITVYEIAEHKERLSDLDKELFDLLASQTATAMTSSRAYSDTVKKLRSLESFVNLIKPT